MLFLPINSRITIMLYDSQAYNIRAKDQRSTHITIDRNDEERLNKLQMTSHRSRLYLPQPEQYQTVEKLARHVRFNHPPASEIPTPMINCSEDGRSQLSSFTTEPINFGDWSFLYESKEWRKVRRNTNQRNGAKYDVISEGSVFIPQGTQHQMPDQEGYWTCDPGIPRST